MAGFHWRLILGAVIGVAVWAAAVALGIPAPLRLLVAWNAGAGVYLAAMWRLFVTSTEAEARARAARLDERRGVILALVITVVLVALIAVVAALVSVKNGDASQRALVAGLAAATVITAWLTLQTIFVAHYAHRHFQLQAQGKEGAFRMEGEPPSTYLDFVYVAICVGATAQVSDPVVLTTSVRNLVTAHAAVAFFYNTAVLALGINMLASLVGS